MQAIILAGGKGTRLKYDHISQALDADQRYANSGSRDSSIEKSRF